MTFLDQPRGRPMTPVDLLIAVENREPSFGEFIGNVAEEIFSEGTSFGALSLPPRAWDEEGAAEFLLRGAELRRRIGFPVTEDDVAQFESYTLPISEEEWRTGPHFREGLEWDERMTADRAEAVAEAHDAMNLRHAIMANRDVGFFDGAAALVTALGVSALDPVNYIPILGPATRARAVARFGQVGGRVLTSAGDAAIGTAAIQPLLISHRLTIGDDVTWQDSAMDIALGAAVGSIVGGVAGVRAARRARLATDQRTMVNATGRVIEAADAVARGDSIDLGATPRVLTDGVDAALVRADRSDPELAVSRGDRPADPWPETAEMPGRRLFLEPESVADVVRFRDLAMQTPGARLQLDLGRLGSDVVELINRELGIDLRDASVVLDQPDARAIENRHGAGSPVRAGPPVTNRTWESLQSLLQTPERVVANPAAPRRSVLVSARTFDGADAVAELAITRLPEGPPIVRVVDYWKQTPGARVGRVLPSRVNSRLRRGSVPVSQTARPDTATVEPDRVTPVAEEIGDEVGEALESDPGTDADIARLEEAGRVSRGDRTALETAEALVARTQRLERAYDAAATCIIGKAA